MNEQLVSILRQNIAWIDYQLKIITRYQYCQLGTDQSVVIVLDVIIWKYENITKYGVISNTKFKFVLIW